MDKNDKTETIVTTIRIPKRVVEQLDRIAQATDRSRNYVIQAALTEYAARVSSGIRNG